MRETRKMFGNAFTFTKVRGLPKYRVGDCVRISKAKRQFKKGYMANWTEELFTIVDAHRSEPPVYRLAAWDGERCVFTNVFIF